MLGIGGVYPGLAYRFFFSIASVQSSPRRQYNPTAYDFQCPSVNEKRKYIIRSDPETSAASLPTSLISYISHDSTHLNILCIKPLLYIIFSLPDWCISNPHPTPTSVSLFRIGCMSNLHHYSCVPSPWISSPLYLPQNRHRSNPAPRGGVQLFM